MTQPAKIPWLGESLSKPVCLQEVKNITPLFFVVNPSRQQIQASIMRKCTGLNKPEAPQI